MNAPALLLALLPLLPPQETPAAPPTPVPAGDAARARPAPAPSGCVACHGDPAHVAAPELRAPVERLAADVHGAVELSCHDCHGGDPDVAPGDGGAAEAAHRGDDWRGRPAPEEIPSFCGRCHSDVAFMAAYVPDVRADQEALYATSVHGQRLLAGDRRVATCLSCHGHHPDGNAQRSSAHGIRAVSDPRGPVHPFHVADTCGSCHSDEEYMQPYDLPTDQADEYRTSVHRHRLVEGEDLSAPTCNDCHGDHGARPPGVESLAFVCGSCHGRQAELFRESTMHAVFADLEVGECLMCHENHGTLSPTDDLLPHGDLARVAQGGVSGDESCLMCHDVPDDPALAASTAMHAGLTGLERDIGAARALIHDAALAGMPVAEAEYVLSGATDALIEARVQVHRFSAPAVLQVTDEGAAIAAEARASGEQALREYYFRHRWLAVSLLGIALVIVSLLLKIRQVDRRLEEQADRG